MIWILSTRKGSIKTTIYKLKSYQALTRSEMNPIIWIRFQITKYSIQLFKNSPLRNYEFKENNCMAETVTTITCNNFASENGDLRRRLWALRVIERDSESVITKTE